MKKPSPTRKYEASDFKIKLILPLSKSRSTRSLGNVPFGSDTVVLISNVLGSGTPWFHTHHM
ncbi:MAG: hypothetical protein M0T78_00315 [Actinomycetota bacterium]|nr:hypothetical protein [Actinomycetota bacterium]